MKHRHVNVYAISRHVHPIRSSSHPTSWIMQYLYIFYSMEALFFYSACKVPECFTAIEYYYANIKCNSKLSLDYTGVHEPGLIIRQRHQRNRGPFWHCGVEWSNRYMVPFRSTSNTFSPVNSTFSLSRLNLASPFNLFK